jgi:hypothetical protein
MKKLIHAALYFLFACSSSVLATEKTNVFPKEPYRASPLLSKPGVEPPLICDDPRKLRVLCNMVLNKSDAPVPMGRYHFRFQTLLFNMSCADPERDSHAELISKVKSVWDYYDEEYLKCNNLQFDVKNGMVSKFAVNTNFDQYVLFMAEFGLDLTRIDKADDRTVLDYIVYQRGKVVAEGTKKNLDIYYDVLRKAGAKHSYEVRGQ